MINPHTKALTMIDLATGWFEIIQYKDKQADTILNLVEKMWLCIYPIPTIIMNNRRNKFLCHAFKNDLIENKYGIKSKCAITTNPQENLILERINKVIANLVHMFDSQKNYLDEDEPWAGILAATAFVVHSMYDTKL